MKIRKPIAVKALMVVFALNAIALAAVAIIVMVPK